MSQSYGGAQAKLRTIASSVREPIAVAILVLIRQEANRLCHGWPFLRAAATGLLLVQLLLSCGVPARAQVPPGEQATSLRELSMEQLGNIVVTSVSKEPEQVWRTPAAIYVITQEDIRRSGATTIPDLLRSVPGVEVAQIDSGKWSVGIRGFGSRLARSVLVLIDGRSVYTPLFAGVYWEMQDTLIEDIDRIEVIRGPGGTIWGSNAVNGVINIITKHSRDTHGALVSVGGGSVDQGALDFRFGGGNDKNWNYRLWGKGFTRGPQFHPDDENFDDWRRVQGGFRADWDLNDKNSLTLEGDTYTSVAGQRLTVASYSPPSQADLKQNIDLSGSDLVAHWKRTLSARSDIAVQAYFDHTNRADINYQEVRDTVDIDFVHHWGLAGHNLIWGAGVRMSPSQFTQTVATVNFLPHRQTYRLYSGFAQDEITLVRNRLFFTVGTKLEHNSFSGFDVQPSGRILWTPAKQHTVWAAITRAVRTPSRIEDNFQFAAQLIPNAPIFLRLIGDGNFSPEEMVGSEFGYRSLVSPAFFVDVTGFYNKYDNLLSVESSTPFVETDPPPFRVILPVFLRNGVEANATGVEFAPVWDLARWARLKASYSFLHLDVKNKPWSVDGSTVAQTEGASPGHMVTIQSLLKLRSNLALDLTYRYASALHHPDVSAYSTADVRFAWSLGEHLEFSVAGRNLLQPRHAEFGSDPGPLVEIKRSVYTSLTWQR